jgi:hypothetical protein
MHVFLNYTILHRIMQIASEVYEAREASRGHRVFS